MSPSRSRSVVPASSVVLRACCGTVLVLMCACGAASGFLVLGGRADRSALAADAPQAPAAAPEAAGLNMLVELLVQIEDDAFRRDLLRGVRDAVKGRRSVAMPKAWPQAAPKLRGSGDAEVRELTTYLSLLFGDPQAVDSLRTTARDRKAEAAERVRALESLGQIRAAGLLELLLGLLDDAAVRGSAVRGLAAFDDPGIPAALLDRYAAFDAAVRRDAVATLASRPKFARSLLEGVASGKVPRTDVSAFTARQLAAFGDAEIDRLLAQTWGAVRATTGDKAALVAKYKGLLNASVMKSANPVAGRGVFAKTCQSCHVLFDAGRKVGPELTGSQRANLDYVLSNLLDPNAIVGRDYQVTVVVTDAGRIVSGIVAEENDNAVVIRTANEDVTVPKKEIEVRKQSPVSMMPEGMLEKLPLEEVRDLVSYLASPSQVPLPKGAEVPTGGSNGLAPGK